MKTGRVVGTIVSPQQHPFYDGRKQLVVRYTRPDGAFDGEAYVVAIDQVGAGMGEDVVVLDEGNSARQILSLPPSGPTRAVIVGIIDSVNTPDSSSPEAHRGPHEQ
ncbi:MAG: ethanolamine utilization protein EutN [Myxococcota bacterium]|jgi:ethanolamine utilization protein EutN